MKTIIRLWSNSAEYQCHQNWVKLRDSLTTVENSTICKDFTDYNTLY